MTAPLTPSDQPPAHSGPQPYPEFPDGPDAPHGARARAGTGPVLRTELRDAAIITAALTAAGAILAVLWVWLAPRVQMVLVGNIVYPKNSESEEAIGGDGTFLLIGLGMGLVTAAVVFWFRRTGGVPVVLALAVGGLLGSWLGWRLGVFLGPETDLAVSARKAGERVPFDGPLELGAKGALLAWPVAAMVMQLILTGLFGPRDPEPDEVGHTVAGSFAPAPGGQVDSSGGEGAQRPAPRQSPPGQQPPGGQGSAPQDR